MQILQVHRSIAICPSQNLRSGRTPMFARATSNFHGKEWFSNVSMKMEGDNEPERTSYGQLCLLFKTNMQEDGLQNVCKELCLVRMYEEVEVDNRVQCPVLRWLGEDHLSYQVVDVSKILKAIHVVPDFENNSQFFINLYKF